MLDGLSFVCFCEAFVLIFCSFLVGAFVFLLSYFYSVGFLGISVLLVGF